MTINMPTLPQGKRPPGPYGLCRSDVAPVTTTSDRSPALADAMTWVEVVARRQGLISSRARRYQLSPDEPAEVSRKTWLRLLAHASNSGDPERLGGWLATTVNRECSAARHRAPGETATPHTCLDGTYEDHCDDRLDAQDSRQRHGRRGSRVAAPSP